MNQWVITRWTGSDRESTWDLGLRFLSILKMMWMPILASTNTWHGRSLWKGRIGFPARSLPKYVPRSMVEAQVTPVSTRMRPAPSRPCRWPLSSARWSGCLHISRRWHAQGRTNSPAGPEPAVYTTDGAGDPEADPGAESEAGPGSLAPVRQPGDAAAIIGSRLSLPLPVFPDGPSHPLPNIGTTAGVGETVGGGTCPVLACRPFHQNQPTTTRSPQESCPASQSSCGRTATRSEPPKRIIPQMRRREGVIATPEVKLNQSVATLVVPNPPGTFPISEVNTPTRPLLSLPGSRRPQNPCLNSRVGSEKGAFGQGQARELQRFGSSC